MMMKKMIMSMIIIIILKDYTRMVMGHDNFCGVDNVDEDDERPQVEKGCKDVVADHCL